MCHAHALVLRMLHEPVLYGETTHQIVFYSAAADKSPCKVHGLEAVTGSKICVWCACLQDDAAATHAAKLEKADGQLDFREDAVVLHNRVSVCCKRLSSTPSSFAR